MSDSKRTRSTALEPPDPGVPADWDDASWMQRSQPGASRLPPGRHNAITRSLYNYSSYKSWAEKVRTSWEAPLPEK